MTFDGLYLSRNFYITSVKVYLTFSHHLISLHFYNKMPEIGVFINNKINFSKWQRWRNSRPRHWEFELLVGNCSLGFEDARQLGAVSSTEDFICDKMSSYVIRHRRGSFAHSKSYIRHKSIRGSKVFMAWGPHKSSFF